MGLSCSQRERVAGLGGFAKTGESQSSGNVTNEQQVLEGRSMEAICTAGRHLSTSAEKDTNTRTLNSLTPVDKI